MNNDDFDKKLDKIDDKLDKVHDKLADVDKRLDVYNSQLSVHIKRSDSNEEAVILAKKELDLRLKPIENYVTYAEGFAKLLGIAVAVMAVVEGLIKLLFKS